MLNRIFRKQGKKIKHNPNHISTPNTYKDFTDFENKIIKEVLPYTMTSRERLKSLINGVEYVLNNDLEGDFVECGVWKGGSAMAIAKTLGEYKSQNRRIWLFDTFDGMSEPSELDKDINGNSAKERLLKEPKETSNVWAFSPIDEVKSNLYSTNYPRQKLHFIKGKVEQTLFQKELPEKIALLRLDTDWYESTKAEMEILFPKVIKNGLVIIDDYGHWEGSKKAVDEYINDKNLTIFLNRIDYTGRLMVKNF